MDWGRLKDPAPLTEGCSFHLSCIARRYGKWVFRNKGSRFLFNLFEYIEGLGRSMLRPNMD